MSSYTIFLPLGVATAAKGGSENLLFFREYIEGTESCVVLCCVVPSRLTFDGWDLTRLRSQKQAQLLSNDIDCGR